jgi:hypothetical protein
MPLHARSLALIVLSVFVCHLNTRGQKSAVVNLRPRVVTSDPRVPAVQVTVDQHRVPLGTPVTFTLTPAAVVSNPLYIVTLNFGDGQRRVVHQSQIPHEYKATGTYAYSVLVTFKGRSDPSNPPRVSLVATPVSVEEGKEVRFAAQLSRSDPALQYRFVFGDGASTDWQNSSQTQHRYRSAGTYRAYVDIGSNNKQIGGSTRKPIEVKKAQTKSLSVSLSANPSRPRSKEPVVFIAEPSSADDTNRYRFTFGDASPSTIWQASPRVSYAYARTGSYRPYVEVVQWNNGRNLTATSIPTFIAVRGISIPTPTPTPGPSPAPTNGDSPTASPTSSTVGTPSPDGTGSPGVTTSPTGGESPGGNGTSTAGTSSKDPPGSGPPWPPKGWWYLIIAALLLYLIYRATGYLFAAQPTFTTFSDPGISNLENATGGAPIDFQLVLNPNVSAVQSYVDTAAPSLIANTNRLGDREIVEI